jgi:hypothetical protein
MLVERSNGVCNNIVNPAMESFSGMESYIQKRPPTMRAPDGWESPRFQAVSLAQGWFRQNGVASSRPPAGNAPRWAAMLAARSKKEEILS